MTTSRRRKGVIAALGACMLGVLVACLWRDDTPPAAPLPAPPALPGPTRAQAPAAPAPQPAPAAVAAPAAAEEKPNPAAPIVDAVTVEKTEVCEGEENLVTVRAHTPDGTDAFLHYAIGGRLGPRVPVRSWIADDGEAPKLQVEVFGKNNVTTVVDVPPFTVKPCKPQRMALISSNLRANTWGEFELEVKLLENPTPGNASFVPFQPRSYEWDFGDGEKATTSGPSIIHNFEGRKQDSLFSPLMVEVKVLGNAEEPVIGRTSLQLINPAFEDLQTKGVVTLLVQLTPRFPELGSDGVVRQKVRLFHMRDRPVFIHSAQVFKHFMNPTGASPQQTEDPSNLLGSSIIPPGKGLEFEAKLDTNKDPNVFSLEHSLEGKDSEGLPVRGTFSVMRPPPRPTKEKNEPVVDAMLKAKIIAARQLLNRPYVTDEDLWALERQGKFAEINARFQQEPGPVRPEDSKEPAPKPPPPPQDGPTAAPGTPAEGKPPAPPKPGSR